MSEEKQIVKQPFKGAQVLWPADMPDDMLEDAIQCAKNAIEDPQFDFDHDPAVTVADNRFDGVRIGGVEVSDQTNFLSLYKIGGQTCKGPHGRQVGAIMARVPREGIRMSCLSRKEQVRLLHIRAKQDLFLNIQSFLSAPIIDYNFLLQS